MLRDFNRLRKAIRRHDSEATEAAWEKCERWVDQLRPNEIATDNLTIPDKSKAG